MYLDLTTSAVKDFSFRLLKFFLPAALLVLAFSFLLYQNEKKAEFASHSTSEQAIVKLAKSGIAHNLEEVNGELLHIAHNPALKRYLDNADETVLEDFVQDMMNFSANHSMYGQVRWIDETGAERVRINNSGGGPKIVPPDQLQNKRQRYYFNDAFVLAPGSIYVSPLDLNVENGKVEVPYKPVLRAATPIADSEGKRRGLIVLNYRGEHLLDSFITATGNSSGQAMLLNKDGYWLKGPTDSDEWTYLSEKDHPAFAKKYPDAWEHIRSKSDGQYLEADGLWTFATVYPLGMERDGNPSGSGQNFIEDEWKVVSHLQSDILFARTDTVRNYVLGGAALSLLLLFGVSWVAARAHMRKLVETDLRIVATAFQSQEGLLITDAEGKILRINRALTLITGYEAEEAIGQTPRILFNSGRQDARYYAQMWDSINHTGGWEGEIWNRRKSGEIFPVYLSITAVKDQHGRVANYVASQVDITQRKAAEQEIQYLAFYDYLTNLPNRRLLMDRLRQALRSSGQKIRGGALLFIDLDNFKVLNDTLGHHMGDMLLQQVAQRLASCVRREDTVARLGGDEFVVMLEGLSEDAAEAAAEAQTVATKILDSFSTPYQLAAHAHSCSPSIGVTLFRNDGDGIEEILQQADIAMYHAKKSGRNMVRFFDPQMQEIIHARVALEAAMQQALDENQFQLYFQMQFSSGQPIGAEVLIRWHHPEFGLLLPNDFIPVAEETGIILKIGEWALDATCAQLKAWEADPQTRPLSLSLNVSAKQFHQPDFVATVRRAVQRHAIDPVKLKLELTESILLEDTDDTVRAMNALKEDGIQFSLDDFGTGYSSLRYIKDLPLFQLKIDKSFVHDINDGSNGGVIVSTIIAMARSLCLNVLAEGVETEEQRQFLVQNGCTCFQGYLFGQPVTLAKFEEQLASFTSSSPRDRVA